MFEPLADTNRLLMHVDLRPVQGDRFQPTGFADLGAAVYTLPDGTRKLLVESAQSMANRLEAVILGPDSELEPALKGLSYVRAQLEGDSDAHTNTLIEAHRLNSPFIITDKGFQKRFVEEAGYKKGKPLDWRRVARALYRYDVNSLLHGVFFANVEDGRLRIQRALTAFIEAEDVREAVSGGVKNNPIDPSGTLRAKGYDKDVYGNVPYPRVEYVAGRITAWFNLDLALLRGYDLGAEATDLLVALALLKVRRLVDGGMRLRTACDLEPVGGMVVDRPEGFTVPSASALLERVQTGIKATGSMFADPPVTLIRTETVRKKSNDSGETE